MKVRILIADDFDLFRFGLKAVLEQQPEMELVGEARDRHQALELARAQNPDLILIELALLDLKDAGADRPLAAELPRVRVLCLSMHAGARFVEAALDAGARGYLLKDRVVAELAPAIAAVMAGGIYVSPAAGGKGTGGAGTGGSRRLPPAPASEVLTRREVEVLRLLAAGRSTPEIAAELAISAERVHGHRRRLMDKLRIRSVAGLTKYAMLERLTSPKPDYSE